LITDVIHGNAVFIFIYLYTKITLKLFANPNYITHATRTTLSPSTASTEEMRRKILLQGDDSNGFGGQTGLFSTLRNSKFLNRVGGSFLDPFGDSNNNTQNNGNSLNGSTHSFSSGQSGVSGGNGDGGYSFDCVRYGGHSGDKVSTRLKNTQGQGQGQGHSEGEHNTNSNYSNNNAPGDVTAGKHTHAHTPSTHSHSLNVSVGGVGGVGMGSPGSVPRDRERDRERERERERDRQHGDLRGRLIKSVLHVRVPLPATLDLLYSSGRWGVCGFPTGTATFFLYKFLLFHLQCKPD
jgi:hypothetical protein